MKVKCKHCGKQIAVNYSPNRIEGYILTDEDVESLTSASGVREFESGIAFRRWLIDNCAYTIRCTHCHEVFESKE